jgi:hypothetical protein
MARDVTGTSSGDLFQIEQGGQPGCGDVTVRVVNAAWTMNRLGALPTK